MVMERDDAGSIPCEIERLFKDQKSREEHSLPKMK